jgi:hypothetical protein
MRCAFAALLLIVAVGAPGQAQSLFGTILGTVTESSQAVIPNAKVTIKNLATNAERVVMTDFAGNYQAPTLPVGVYEVACEVVGFKRAVAKSVTLEVDEKARVDIHMEVGETRQTVEISSVAPLIDTDTASQGTVIGSTQIVQLPLNGRDFQQLAILGPGVIAPVNGGSGGTMNISGVRGVDNSFVMDGATNTNVNANGTYIEPSIELIQEFKVQRNTFNAEYGRGAAQVNVVTKSGSNQWHGTLFEFLRNDELQARNFFDPSKKPALRRNQFGGLISGPMEIPKAYHGHNKTFWLFDYEGVRQRSPITTLAAVPTQAELTGNLSDLGTPVIDPTTKAPFPNNQIPASRIDPTTAKFIPYMPVTTALRGSVGKGLNMVVPVSAVGPQYDQLTARVDHNVSSSNNLFGRYTFNDNTVVTPGILPLYAQAQPSRQQNAVFGDNWIIRPNLINELRIALNRHSLHLFSHLGAASSTNFAQQLGFQNLIADSNPTANSLPSVGMTGLSALGGIQLIEQRVNSWSFVDNLSYIRGNHTVKVGIDIRRMLFDARNVGPTEGAFSFTGVFTGNPIGDFLLGIPQTASGTLPPGPDGVNLSTLWQWFVQDDWKVTKNLTVSVGIRYEYAEPWVNNLNHISIFDSSFPGGRLIYPGAAVYYVPGPGYIPTSKPLASTGLYTTTKLFPNFAPRFGFAWRPFGGARTSVRGSYGIFTEAPNENNNIFSVGNPPQTVQQTLLNDVTKPSFTWSQVFPATAGTGSATVASVAPFLAAGYLQQWSLNIEHELAPNLGIEVGYMGSKGTHLDQRRYLNQAFLDANPNSPTPIASRTPFPAFSPVLNYYDHTGVSDYQALIARIERKFSRGFTFLASYTFSKSIDNSSYAGNIGSQPADPQNTYNLKAEKGLSLYDVPQRFVVSYIWEMPFGHGKPWLNSGAAAAALGGWQLTGITQFQSGNPFSILVAGDVANIGTAGVERANVVGNPFPSGFVRGGPARLALNTAAFAVPARGTFGNSGRNIIRDAGINNWDVGLFRDIRFTERIKLQFRAESFNTLNHTQFTLFGNVVNTPTFGIWNSARPPRIFQLGLKLIY